MVASSLEERIAAVVKGSLAVALEGIEGAAVDAGLPRGVALSLAHQALLGTAALMKDETESPAGLKDRVASPGGTTIAGLAVLEEGGVRGALMRAVETVGWAGEGGER
jgi:pyrroline-5-carboxylate reductase